MKKTIYFAATILIGLNARADFCGYGALENTPGSTSMDEVRIQICQRALNELSNTNLKLDDIKRENTFKLGGRTCKIDGFAAVYEKTVKPKLINQNCHAFTRQEIEPILSSKQDIKIYAAYASEDKTFEDACNAQLILTCLNKMTQLRIKDKAIKAFKTSAQPIEHDYPVVDYIIKENRETIVEAKSCTNSFEYRIKNPDICASIPYGVQKKPAGGAR